MHSSAAMTRIQPHTQRLPCCTYVAMWLRLTADRGPAIRQDDWRQYAALDRKWWAIANVATVTADELPAVLHDPDDDREWGILSAGEELLGGEIYWAAPGEPPPPLTPGRWHVVQEWRQSGTGHAYLVYGRLRGIGVILESSVAHGFFATVEQWVFSRSTTVGVLTLPESVQ